MFNLEALKKGTYYQFKLTDGTLRYGTFIEEGLRTQPRYANTYAARRIVIEKNGSRDILLDTNVESVVPNFQHNGGYLKRKQINGRKKSRRSKKSTRSKKSRRSKKSTRGKKTRRSKR